MLLFKGMEEFRNVVEHSKQRHHIIGQYVLAREHLVQDAGAKDQGMSEFLKNFYSSNYFWSLSSLLWIHLMWGFAFGCRLQINMISNLYCNLLLDNDQLLFVSGHLKTLMLSKTGSFAENEMRKLCFMISLLSLLHKGIICLITKKFKSLYYLVAFREVHLNGIICIYFNLPPSESCACEMSCMALKMSWEPIPGPIFLRMMEVQIRGKRNHLVFLRTLLQVLIVGENEIFLFSLIFIILKSIFKYMRYLFTFYVRFIFYIRNSLL